MGTKADKICTINVPKFFLTKTYKY